MARKVIVAGASERIDETAIRNANARADSWLGRWKEYSPQFAATSLRDQLRDEGGARAIHFTLDLANGSGLPRMALEAVKASAIASMTLALRDPELSAHVVSHLEQLGARPADATAAILDAPGDLTSVAVNSVAWLFLRSISEPTDVTRFMYPEAFGRGERVTGIVDLPRVADVARFIKSEREDVRAAVMSHVSSDASYLRDTALAEAAISLLEDPACQQYALKCAVFRPDLAPVERLERLLATSTRPGQVWSVLVQRGRVEEAIVAFHGADEPLQQELAFALGDHGGQRGQALLLEVLASEAKPLSLRRAILAWFSERGKTSIVNRFRHQLDRD